MWECGSKRVNAGKINTGRNLFVDLRKPKGEENEVEVENKVGAEEGVETVAKKE